MAKASRAGPAFKHRAAWTATALLGSLSLVQSVAIAAPQDAMARSLATPGKRCATDSIHRTTGPSTVRRLSVRGTGCARGRAVVGLRRARSLRLARKARQLRAVMVGNEAEFRAAWGNPRQRRITLERDIFLRACRSGDPIRESLRPMTIDGNGHAITQTCFEKRLMRQDGTGFLVIQNLTLTRGGSDGPGAAVTTRGEILVVNSRVMQNLSEEPGGGIFSQRRATVVHSVFTGNLANDDGGAIYARRGGVQVYDSLINDNLVDGSGGAIGSTGDILVANSEVRGNTTDGDGGALYTDEDGDITVVGSEITGNTADGPGGAIFTLDGDVTIVNSALLGNRADDRGGAISGEANVTLINSTVARNIAVAHVAGGVWARGDAFATNSTIANNYAEGEGGGILAAGTVGLAYSTVTNNSASSAGDVGAGERLLTVGSILGPPNSKSETGHAQRTSRTCEVSPFSVSFGSNLVADPSCRTTAPGDVISDEGPELGPLLFTSGVGETLMPLADSLAIDAIPPASCRIVPFGYRAEGEQHLAEFGIDPMAPVTTDQRGVPRPQGGDCDIGAVEAPAVAP